MLSIIFGSAGLAWVSSDLKLKTSAQKNDVRVAMAVDWEDIVVFGADLKELPATVVIMASACDLADEMRVRQSGKKILWRLDDSVRPEPWIARFQLEDGIFVAGEHALEHPRLFRDIPGELEKKNGFLVLMEFVPNALQPRLASRVPDRLIKGHVLPTREILSPNARLWKARLLRAVEERWVRLLVVRFSPALSLEENRLFQISVADELTARGFVIGPPGVFSRWPVASTWPFRLKLALLISIVAPLVGLAWAARVKGPSIVVFMAVSSLTVLAGLVLHGLGATPSSVLGLSVMRGVKLQLLLPLLLAGSVLLTRQEIKRLMNLQLKVKHLVLAAAGLGGILALYLMRSGNFPLLPVSDGERYFRDGLDQLLGARPRFKEFAIGHPLFLIGLALKNRPAVSGATARYFLWAGLIGQISILNTFTHFSSPLFTSLLRSFNGIGVGCLLAAPFLLLISSRR